MIELLLAIVVGIFVVRGIMWIYDTWTLGREALRDDTD